MEQRREGKQTREEKGGKTGSEERREREREREKGERKKKKGFSWCSDGRNSVAREAKLVYSTRTTSRYQERKDSVLHAPRDRGFSYSSSFSFKGHKWPCGSDPTTGLMRLFFGQSRTGF